MLKRLLPFVAALVSFVAFAGTAQAGTQTVPFSTVGEHAFTVPEGVTTLHVVAVGAAGGASTNAVGGQGLQVTGDIAVTPGQVLYAEVGGPGHDSASNSGDGAGGANGGANGGDFGTVSAGAGGGGASDLRFAQWRSLEIVGITNIDPFRQLAHVVLSPDPRPILYPRS